MELKRVGGLSVLVAALAASMVTAQVQDPAAKAAAILAESRKAIGGDDKLAAIKTLEIKGTSNRGATDVNLQGDMTIVMELPGKYLRKESIILGNAGIDIVEGLNGTEAWEEQKFSGNMNFGDDGGGGNRGGGFRGAGAAGQNQNAAAGAAADPEAAKQAQLSARQTEVARVLLALLLTTDRPLRYIGQVASPQATAEAIEMTAPDGPVRILIDSKTYMPLLLTWTGVAQDPIAALAGRSGFRGRGRGGRGGFQNNRQQQTPQQAAAEAARADLLSQPTAIQMFLSEYKTVNGVKLPHLIVRQSRDQVTEEWVIKSYKFNPNLKADTFKK
jgi:hypothetical protein